MNHLLERQRKKILGNILPSPELEAFLKMVSNTYDSYDADRKFLEHSFEVSSKEFLELHNNISNLLKELQIEKKSVDKKVIERTEELTIANKRLSELDKVKTEFISVAAHQLRTPLSAIKWTLSLLIDESSENLTIEQHSLLLKGYESNERAINLINKMLVVTRIESGKMEYELAFIHIEDLINTTLLDFTGYAKTREVKLMFEKTKNQLPYIQVDPEKIRSVIGNLIENAISYTKKGGKVILSATNDQDFIKVTVKDDGIGIPTRQQLAIFNKFFRADNATKMKTDGSGLGLFIAKNIIEKHGGEIGFKSEENVGTAFYFTLPIVKYDKKEGGSYASPNDSLIVYN